MDITRGADGHVGIAGRVQHGLLDISHCLRGLKGTMWRHTGRAWQNGEQDHLITQPKETASYICWILDIGRREPSANDKARRCLWLMLAPNDTVKGYKGDR